MTLTMADGPRVEVRAVLSATPDQVWPLVTDLGLSPRNSAENRSNQWLDEADGPSVGARFRSRNERGRFQWETTCTVVVCDEPHAFAWVVNDPELPVATWGYDLTATEDGTEARHWALLGPGESGLTDAIGRNPDREGEIIQGRMDVLAASMQANLDDLAQQLGHMQP